MRMKRALQRCRTFLRSGPSAVVETLPRRRDAQAFVSEPRELRDDVVLARQSDYERNIGVGEARGVVRIPVDVALRTEEDEEKVEQQVDGQQGELGWGAELAAIATAEKLRTKISEEEELCDLESSFVRAFLDRKSVV